MQMIYRPQTKDKHYQGKAILKVQFAELPVDAFVVTEEEAIEHCQKGWFSHPNDMKAKDDNSKRTSKRRAKTS